MVSGRPPHQITRGEVRAWLAASVVKRTTLHATDRHSARAIITQGVDMSRAKDDAGWGRGPDDVWVVA
jgi:hypothetical protein